MDIIDRRDFMKNIAALAACAGMASLPFDANSAGHKKEHKEGHDDNLVVIGVSDEWKSLEDVLSEGSEEISVVRSTDEVCNESGCEIDTNILPSLLYTFEIDSTAEKGGVCGFSYKNLEAGSCIMLNREGFLLTARHVVDNYVMHKNRLLLFYNPISGIIRRPRVIAYSKTADIALCRINAEGAEFKQNTVTKGDLKEKTLLYSTAYTPSIFASKEFVSRIMKNSRIGNGSKNCGMDYGNSGSYSLGEKEPLKVDPKDLGIGTVFSAFDENLAAKQGEPWEGNPVFVCSDMTHGNSGTALFDIRSKDIVGIFYRLGGGLACGFGTDSRNDSRIAACVNPANIRKLISGYVQACRDSGSR